jgi:hypothetical protein
MPQNNPMKSWTVMVYLARRQQPRPNGTKDLMEMKRVGTNANTNVVAQFDSASAAHKTRRYLLTKNSNLAGDVVATLGNLNTGDPKNLVDFATWAITTYPARRYFLVLWNHGQGWDDTDIFAGERGRKRPAYPFPQHRATLFSRPRSSPLRNWRPRGAAVPFPAPS